MDRTLHDSSFPTTTPYEDADATQADVESDASERVQNTAYGQVRVSGRSIKLKRNGVAIPKFEEQEFISATASTLSDEEAAEREAVRQQLEDLEQMILRFELAAQPWKARKSKSNRRKSLVRSIRKEANSAPSFMADRDDDLDDLAAAFGSTSLLHESTDVPADPSPSSVRRTEKLGHRATPYPTLQTGRSRVKKSVKTVRFEPVLPIHSPSPLRPLPPARRPNSPPLPSQYDLYPYIPSPPLIGSEHQRVPEAYEPYNPPPTSHPSAPSVPLLEHDDSSLVPTRPNSPAPIEIAILPYEGMTSYLAMDTGSVIKRLGTEQVEVSSHRRVSKLHRRVYRPNLGCYEENLDTDDEDEASTEAEDNGTEDIVRPVDAQGFVVVADEPTPEQRAAAESFLDDLESEMAARSPHLLLENGFDRKPPQSDSRDALQLHDTPTASTPALSSGYHRDSSPEESPYPWTPPVPPEAESSNLEAESSKHPDYEAIFGGLDDEDEEDYRLNSGCSKGKGQDDVDGAAPSTENAGATSRRSSTPPARALSETFVDSETPAQPSLPPSTSIAAVVAQDEQLYRMAWPTATPQTPQFHSAFASSPPTFMASASFKPPPVSSWSPAPVFAPSISAWTSASPSTTSISSWASAPFWSSAPPLPSTSSWSASSSSSFCQPFVANPISIPQCIAVPQLASHTDNVIQSHDVDMDTAASSDMRVDIKVPHLGRHDRRRRRPYGHQRAAMRLLQIAAIEPRLKIRAPPLRRFLRSLTAIQPRHVKVCAHICAELGVQSVREAISKLRRHDVSINASPGGRLLLDVQRRQRRAHRAAQHMVQRVRLQARRRRHIAEPPSLHASEAMAIDPSPGRIPMEDIEMDGNGWTVSPAFDSQVDCDMSAIVIQVTAPSPPPTPVEEEQPLAKDSVNPHQSSLFFDVPTSTSAQTPSASMKQSIVMKYNKSIAVSPTSENDLEPVAAPAEPAVINNPPLDEAEETDDETEWEPVAIPDTNDEGVPPSSPLPVEQNAPAKALPEVPAPVVAQAGPERVVASNGFSGPPEGRPKRVGDLNEFTVAQDKDNDQQDAQGEDEDDEDAVSLGKTDDELEIQQYYGDLYNDEDYDEGEDDDYTPEEDEETSEEEGDEEGEEESNEYDESALINPTKRPVAAKPSPAPAPEAVSVEESPYLLVTATPPTVSAASSSSNSGAPTIPTQCSVPSSGSGGPQILPVVADYNGAGSAYNLRLLANAACVSTENRPSGEAVQAARLRRREAQMKQDEARRKLIQSISAQALTSQSTETASASATRTSGPSQQDLQPPDEDQATKGQRAHSALRNETGPSYRPQTQAPGDDIESFVRNSEPEVAETIVSRPDKGKGKAKDTSDTLVETQTTMSTDSAAQDIARALDPETLIFNLASFSGDSHTQRPSGSGSRQFTTPGSERRSAPSIQQSQPTQETAGRSSSDFPIESSNREQMRPPSDVARSTPPPTSGLYGDVLLAETHDDKEIAAAWAPAEDRLSNVGPQAFPVQKSTFPSPSDTQTSQTARFPFPPSTTDDAHLAEVMAAEMAEVFADLKHAFGVDTRDPPSFFPFDEAVWQEILAHAGSAMDEGVSDLIDFGFTTASEPHSVGAPNSGQDLISYCDDPAATPHDPHLAIPAFAGSLDADSLQASDASFPADVSIPMNEDHVWLLDVDANVVIPPTSSGEDSSEEVPETPGSGNVFDNTANTEAALQSRPLELESDVQGGAMVHTQPQCESGAQAETSFSASAYQPAGENSGLFARAHGYCDAKAGRLSPTTTFSEERGEVIRVSDLCSEALVSLPPPEPEVSPAAITAAPTAELAVPTPSTEVPVKATTTASHAVALPPDTPPPTRWRRNPHRIANTNDRFARLDELPPFAPCRSLSEHLRRYFPPDDEPRHKPARPRRRFRAPSTTSTSSASESSVTVHPPRSRPPSPPAPPEPAPPAPPTREFKHKKVQTVPTSKSKKSPAKAKKARPPPPPPPPESESSSSASDSEAPPPRRLRPRAPADAPREATTPRKRWIPTYLPQDLREELAAADLAAEREAAREEPEESPEPLLPFEGYSTRRSLLTLAAFGVALLVDLVF
ncbi:hypothetical protein BD311DRAFT_864277 [Dichomitus squalens]|uniref:Uncharacterized protein n=1 Tax=Dichomitus squalens TaxID=114155 RepID=A0A4Q9MSH8_9APHY|nr:hypothetical protein BD311DRAFT_864277 [Dichomitus squalens]